jgi:ATP-dependent Clp protease adapter protein ClpS
MFPISPPVTPPKAYRPWTYVDDLTLMAFAPTMTTRELANTLQRSIEAVYQRASELKVSLKPSDPPTFAEYVWGGYR